MSRRFARKAIIVALVAFLVGCPGTIPEPPQRRTLIVDGRTRTATLYVPTWYHTERTWPLVVLLHSTGYDGGGFLTGNGWPAKAEAAGFIVVAPDALGLDPDQPATLFGNPAIWDFGVSNGSDSNDLQFVDMLITTLSNEFVVDPGRIYVAGHSSGGAMTFILGLVRPRSFAAIAVLASPFAGSIPPLDIPMPTLYIQGTADPIVPIEGGGSFMGASVPPLETTLSSWASVLGCTGARVLTSNENGIERSGYHGCANGVPFEVILVSSLGHRWPGGTVPNAPDEVLGPSSNALDGTDAVWSFFARHTRASLISAEP